MKKGEMSFTSDSYLAISALDPEKDSSADPVGDFMVEWNRDGASSHKFSRRLRKLADWIDAHSECSFEVSID